MCQSSGAGPDGGLGGLGVGIINNKAAELKVCLGFSLIDDSFHSNEESKLDSQEIISQRSRC